MKTAARWAPASVLSLGALLTFGLGSQQKLELRQPLAEAVPITFGGIAGQDVTVSADEAAVAGFDSYLLRNYDKTEVYVGYYASQAKGHTIHSPKNCLPGAGWEALSSSSLSVATADGRNVIVNRYLLQQGDSRALVLYWYQGRGRVESNEYAVKWDLLRDSALEQRSDEALVRIVVPIVGNEQEAEDQAARVAADLVPSVDSALPL